MTGTTAPPAATAAPPWTTPLLRTRGLLISGTLAAVVYGVLANAYRTACPTQSAGVTTAQCEQFVMTPSPIVFFAMVVALLVGVGRAARRSEPRAVLRTLDRTGSVIIAIALGSAAIAQVWFWLLPLQPWVDHGGSLWFPVPFGSVSF
ncbi:MAG TPA: hypothetical protein VGE78_04205 [Agromyces sp.]